MGERDLRGSIERLRGLGEEIDRAISEARLKRAELQDRHVADELHELRRMIKQQARKRGHGK